MLTFPNKGDPVFATGGLSPLHMLVGTRPELEGPAASGGTPEGAPEAVERPTCSAAATILTPTPTHDSTLLDSHAALRPDFNLLNLARLRALLD